MALSRLSRTAVKALSLIALCAVTMGAECTPTPTPTGCDDAERVACDDASGTWNEDACSCCAPGAHEVQECEFGKAGVFDLELCECVTPCDEAEAATCENSQGVYNWETCACCQAGAHQVQACEFGLGGTFNWSTCACDVSCSYDSDCAFGDECGSQGCTPSDCHAGNPADSSVAPRECPAGYGCEFGDGVDYNHGNGHCVETACAYNSDCVFAYECRSGLCVESDCHAANPTDPTVGERYCPEGFGCEYGDGVDYNHGNGYCAAVPAGSTSP
jgi:hypothetical protein